MLRYLLNISSGKIVLWCYLIWYGTTLFFYFDPAPRIWLNSLGISVLIGIALQLGVARPVGARTDHWQTFRLFATPFCVSSFSSLIKDKGFFFVMPPRPLEQAVATGACAAFIVFVFLVKTLAALARQRDR